MLASKSSLASCWPVSAACLLCKKLNCIGHDLDFLLALPEQGMNWMDTTATTRPRLLFLQSRRNELFLVYSALWPAIPYFIQKEDRFGVLCLCPSSLQSSLDIRQILHSSTECSLRGTNLVDHAICIHVCCTLLCTINADIMKSSSIQFLVQACGGIIGNSTSKVADDILDPMGDAALLKDDNIWNAGNRSKTIGDGITSH